MNQAVVDQLIVGRERIANGWCKFRLQEGAGDNIKYCALGAIVIRDSMRMQAYSDAHNFLHEALVKGNYPTTDVVDYNNVIAKSKEDVVELFDKAICLAMGA